MERAKTLFLQGELKDVSPSLAILFSQRWSNVPSQNSILDAFVQLDDVDIMILLKNALHCDDFILRTLSRGLIQRQLFKVQFFNKPLDTSEIQDLKYRIADRFGIDSAMVDSMIYEGKEQVEIYNPVHEQIRIYQKNGQTVDLSEVGEFDYFRTTITKYYLCHPRIWTKILFRADTAPTEKLDYPASTRVIKISCGYKERTG